MADAVEKAVVIRQLALAATLQIVAEERMALANRTCPEQRDILRMQGGDLVDSSGIRRRRIRPVGAARRR